MDLRNPRYAASRAATYMGGLINGRNTQDGFYPDKVTPSLLGNDFGTYDPAAQIQTEEEEAEESQAVLPQLDENGNQLEEADEEEYNFNPEEYDQDQYDSKIEN